MEDLSFILVGLIFHQKAFLLMKEKSGIMV